MGVSLQATQPPPACPRIADGVLRAAAGLCLSHPAVSCQAVLHWAFPLTRKQHEAAVSGRHKIGRLVLIVDVLRRQQQQEQQG